MATFDSEKAREERGILEALGNTDICIFWYYPKERLLKPGDRMIRMYGCKKEYPDMPKSFADDFIHPSTKDAYFEMYQKIDAGEKTAQASFSSIDKKNWYTVTLTTISVDEQGCPEEVCGVVQKISESKRQETECHSGEIAGPDRSDAEIEKEREAREALEKAYEAANRANAIKSAFLNNMSHDIRTPMNAIVGFAAIAAAHINDRDRVQDCIAKITASSRHLLSIINEVLDMSRIESGKIHIQEQETNLPTVLHDFMNVIREQIRMKGLELFVDTMNLTHENVYADEARLHRLLLNLVGNAIKFTPAGGMISIRLAEKPQTSASCGNYVISVRDTGIGISKEFLPHVFEPFEREETSTVSKMEGTGLGMPITKNIIEMMGGSISVESEKGKGTTFTVELPLRLMEHEPEEPRIEKLAGLRAMVVDDDYHVCDSVAKMLDKIGMEPEWTMTGKEAILHTKSAMEMGRCFSAYVVDLRLPDMSGVEVVRQLRALAGDKVPIYILTAYDFSDVKHEAKKAGVTAFCQKPLFLSQLRTVLLTAVGEYKDRQKEPEYKRSGNLFGKQILLVEDNELNREIAVDILTEEGLIVDIAENGKAAVDKIKAAKDYAYDMILMDIQMPIMDGYEATRIIRGLPSEWTKELPILAMTANAFEEDRMKALKNGMNGYLAKPIDMEQLFRTLDEVLG